MPRAQYLGELEIVVLLTMARLDGPTHGMALYDDIVTLTGREISAPTVYITVARLLKKGFVKAAPTPADERAAAGRNRKYYALTAAGRQAGDRAARMFESLRPAAARGGR